MTGVDTDMGANEFYKEAVRGTLKPNQIKFSKRHPYDLCAKKMSQIKNICAVIDSDLLILSDMTTGTFVYKFGLTELNFTIGVSYDLDKNGNKKSDVFIARSLRVEDSFAKGQIASEVDFILKKRNDQKLYSEITFFDKRRSLQDIPTPAKCLIEPVLLIQ